MWSAISLPVLLAIRSMRHHRIVVVATVLGVAIGMTVVCAILIVDNNTRDVPPDQPQAFVETEAAMSLVSIAVAILGVASPVRAIFKMEIARILQPRFLSEEARSAISRSSGFVWLLPAALGAAYVLVRPFLISWMSVVHFFCSKPPS